MTESPAPSPHIPVLLHEVVESLAPRDGGVYVDGTFGAGGYSRALLESADCRVWGIDRDPAAIERGQALAQRFPGRLEVIEGCFGDMAQLLGERGVAGVDGIALDVGVSSPQIDEPERGFSFRFDGPLDMRMGRDGPTAADVVNHADESELADILYHLGEERRAYQVARAIVAARQTAPILRTKQLADVVRAVVPKGKGDAIDPATRSFQALRIHVNDELGELRRGLAAAESLLAPGGRLAVVSFHSLEDREVKTFLKERSSPPPSPSRHTPSAPAAALAPSFRLLSRKPQAASEAEARHNPRARSARLRAAERTEAPGFPASGKEAA
ncbi:16S rRNA (cytosine(1402)-N(4))-methyltransferase RsmH [Azospirillum doebereinerae]|uniref:Ribosomal RNA small subunit methyltransferase H n=1 Tax=Azospirillum doebereinerae TaxID=92933 RepID=A0A3S0V3J9_9PROT|nr:16S rRNA (cytosine(1402)-N(4))-methyltransferase RsmH [Azospirillum doebereinerae]MCG5242191.1 16S rRNA (cytosine(1402)-N(4))-methyltransferase RsmH [Azospirillum doebereinerae]RUQ75588.1 16S rRNA (cytosine(1402)-N(4))-methyltransferase RsmH [Azospirillum doebereinerae]